MFYEHATYSELWRSLPSPGSKIKTSQGNDVLDGVDLDAESVKVRFPDGREVPVLIADFPNFKETVLRGEVWKQDSLDEEGRKAPLSHRLRSGAPEVKAARLRSSLRTRRLKPEKISLEEHIAGRAAAKRAESPRQERAEPPRQERAEPSRQERADAQVQENLTKRSSRRQRGDAPGEQRESPGSRQPSVPRKERPRQPDPRRVGKAGKKEGKTEAKERRETRDVNEVKDVKEYKAARSPQRGSPRIARQEAQGGAPSGLKNAAHHRRQPPRRDDRGRRGGEGGDA
jgi:hypothetical protein